MPRFTWGLAALNGRAPAGAAQLWTDARRWCTTVVHASHGVAMIDKLDVNGLVRQLTENLPASLQALKGDVEAHAGRVLRDATRRLVGRWHVATRPA